MSEQKIFEVPWGSESICFWCRKQGQCSLYRDDPEIPTRTLPANANPPSLQVLENAGARVRFTQLLKLGSLRNCPINEFEPNYTKLPDTFKGHIIIERGR